MRKNRNRPESDEPLSEGRVEYLEAARQRVRNRRIRRTAVLLVLLTAAARAALITTARNLCMVFIEKELLCLFSARPARRVYHIMGAPKNQGTAQLR